MGILSGVGDFISGAKEGLFGAKGPDHIDVASLDPNTQALVNNEQAQGGMSAEQIHQNQQQGVNAAGQDVMNAQLGAGQFGAAQDPGMSAAIQQKAQKSYDRDLNSIQRTSRLDAELKRNKRLNERSNVFQNEAAYNLQTSKAKLNVKMGQHISRVNTINSIINTGAQIAGGALGGPAGAKAAGSAAPQQQSQPPGESIQGWGTNPNAK